MRAICSCCAWRADSASALVRSSSCVSASSASDLTPRELVGQFRFGFRAHTRELAAQRFAGLGLGGQTRLGDRRFTSRRGLLLDSRQFRGPQFGGLGAHAFELGGELGFGHRLHERDLRRVHFRIDRFV